MKMSVDSEDNIPTTMAVSSELNSSEQPDVLSVFSHPPSLSVPFAPLHFVTTVRGNRSPTIVLSSSLRLFSGDENKFNLNGMWKIYDENEDADACSTSHFIHIPFIPQVGPQCGFAALAMIASSIGITVSPDELVCEAKDLNYTNFGEMFSVDCMAQFAELKLGQYFNISIVNNSLSGQFQQIKEHIHHHSLIMIAYDADYNHEPCKAKGHRAHWAVICGYIYQKEEGKIFILARHGKSRHTSLWKFSSLRRSNDNLHEAAPERRKSSVKSYKIPNGGVKEGLASKWVLFERKHPI